MRLRILPLAPPLHQSFKLISASVSSEAIFGSINHEPRLLVAYFEVNGDLIPIMVDTGATISSIPEFGSIMQRRPLKTMRANMNARLANNSYVNINKKVMLYIRPKGDIQPAKLLPFYVQNKEKTICGHQALLCLDHLKTFNLEIKVRNGRIIVCHNHNTIGNEMATPIDSYSSLKSDDRFDSLHLDNELVTIIKRNKRVFTDLDQEPIRGKPMRFITFHQRPIFAKQRHYSSTEIIQMKEHVEGLLRQGIIEPTTSGYAATSRIIPKKSGKGRLVVNYIPLNNVTMRNSYSLPHVADIFGVIQGNKYFTTMDCEQGFYQILVDPRDRHKTAFSTPVGNYQYVRCPFGAINSCATFQAEMNRIFAEGLYTRCVIYVDDILVFGRTKEEHDNNLAWVLARCSEYNVKLKLEKCNFFKTEVEYLGFLITGNSIAPTKKKCDSLLGIKPPTDKTELRSVVGKLNFYSRFIPNYSKQLEPLRELFRKNKDFQWRPYHQAVLNKIIESLSTSTPQMIANRKDDKVIELLITDDSLETLCISKEGRLIHRAGRFLTAAEASYSLIEKQLLAIILAFKKFKTFLDPEHITIRVPTNGVEKVLSMKNRPERVEYLLLKIPLGFDTFKFEIKETLLERSSKQSKDHIPQEIYYVDGACKLNGKPNCEASWAVCAEFDRELTRIGFVKESPSNNAAELTAAIEACKLAKEKCQTEITIVTDSKYLHSAATLWIDKWCSNDWLDHKKKPVVNKELFLNLIHAKEGLQIEWIHVKGHGDVPGNIRADSLARSLLDEQQRAICCAAIRAEELQDDEVEIQQVKQQILSGIRNDLCIEDNVVYYIDNKLPQGDQLRIYVPSDHRKWLLKLAHDNQLHGGHSGIKTTHRKLIRFWWPRMHRDVELYVKSCDTCQRFKENPGLPPGYLKSIPVSRVFEHLHIDIIGPLKSTYKGSKYIVTATDAFSKWAYAKAVKNTLTEELIRFLEDNIIAIHGKPEVIISDQGPQFTSNEWKDYLRESEIGQNMTTGYNPQANGIDERLNGSLTRILRAYVDEFQTNWDEKLKWALYAYNTRVHSSTGYSPYQLIHGLDPRSPLKGPTNLEIDSINDINKTRDSMRTDAIIRNMQAQENQATEYNRRHSEFKLNIGDLVLAREQTAPVDLSKKLYPKWDGPCVIIGFVGDQTKKAAIVLNCSTMKKKTLALRHIKPYLERSSAGFSFMQNPSTEREKSKEKGEAQEPEEEEPSYIPLYMPQSASHSILRELRNQSEERSSQERSSASVAQAPHDITEQRPTDIDSTPERRTINSNRNSIGLDLTEANSAYPMSSSPRRVTIDTVPTIYNIPNFDDTLYEDDTNQKAEHAGKAPSEAADDSDTTIVSPVGSHETIQDLTPSSAIDSTMTELEGTGKQLESDDSVTMDIEPSYPLGEVETTSDNFHEAQPEPDPTYKSPYIVDFIRDDSIRDPDYRPTDESNAKPTAELTGAPRKRRKTSSTSTHTYNLRSVPGRPSYKTPEQRHDQTSTVPAVQLESIELDLSVEMNDNNAQISPAEETAQRNPANNQVMTDKDFNLASLGVCLC